MVIYIQERSATGTTKRLPATEVYNFLNQQTNKDQLTTNLSIIKLSPKTGLSSDALRNYMDTPPAGKRELLLDKILYCKYQNKYIV